MVWLEYHLQLHKCLIANSAEEAYQKIKPIAKELKKLALWEKEGKIKGDGHIDPRGFQDIQLIDESIEPELRQMQLIYIFEMDECAPLDEYYPDLYDDNEDDSEPVKNKKQSDQGGK